MRRSVLALSLGLIGVGALGCKSTQKKLQDSIQQAFEEDPNAGNMLCGFPVQGLTGVTVTSVTNSGSSSSGAGTASVSGTPVPLGGMPVASPTCTGTVSFRYDTTTTRSGFGRNRRSRSTFHVYNIMVTTRAGQPVNTMAGMGVPNTMGNMGATGRNAAMPGVATPTQLGMVVTGNLAVGDTPLTDGSVADDYSIQLTAGMPVTIVTRGGPSATTPGSNLDVYTILLQNGVELTHDDDSAGNLNSRIVYTPPTTGIYTIRVTTWGSGLKQGMYTLQTYPGALPTVQ